MLIAMDRQSVRTVSKDGHLHIAISHISKANVCPYRGAEIPNGEDLGLDPEKVYQLLRHPDELAKAASTFNNLPVLYRHIPVTSADHPREFVVGSTGTDAAWNEPYLDNSLVIWDDEAIAGVESDQQRELSAAYHYVAEMTPGEYKGLRYDGIMRNIAGNHVALVPEGRAGSDVIVGDSKLETPVMAKRLKSRKALLVSGAVRTYLRPKLATDAKLDLNPILEGITAKNYKGQKAKLVLNITNATKGKLAQDAELGDVIELLDSLDDVTDGDVDEDVIAEAAAEAGGVAAESDTDDEDEPAAVDADGDKIAKLLEFLKGKLSDEDFASATELVGASADEPDEDPADTTPVGDGGGKPMKTGMDAKMITAKVQRRLQAIRTAERDVRPLVGELTIAMDSAAAVYKFALDAEKVDVTGVHPSAYGALVAQVIKGKDGPGRAKIAQDAATEGAGDFSEMFPNARAPKRI